MLLSILKLRLIPCYSLRIKFGVLRIVNRVFSFIETRKIHTETFFKCLKFEYKDLKYMVTYFSFLKFRKRRIACRNRSHHCENAAFYCKLRKSRLIFVDSKERVRQQYSIGQREMKAFYSNFISAAPFPSKISHPSPFLSE